MAVVSKKITDPRKKKPKRKVGTPTVYREGANKTGELKAVKFADGRVFAGLSQNKLASLAEAGAPRPTPVGYVESSDLRKPEKDKAEEKKQAVSDLLNQQVTTTEPTVAEPGVPEEQTWVPTGADRTTLRKISDALGLGDSARDPFTGEDRGFQSLDPVGVGLPGAGAVAGASRLLKVGKTEVAVSKVAESSKLVKAGIFSKMGAFIKANPILSTGVGITLGAIGPQKWLGRASARASSIESAVGKRGEYIAKGIEMARNGYPPELVMQNYLTLGLELDTAEQTLKQLSSSNPDLLLNPEKMDSAFAELIKIKQELESAKLQLLVLAANPQADNVENLALILEELEKE